MESERDYYARYSALLHVHREAPHLASWEEVEHARNRLDTYNAERGVYKRTDLRTLTGTVAIHLTQGEHSQSDERVGSRPPAG
jgi:hypothetical protein